MGQRYVIAAILSTGRLRRVCAEARDNRIEAEKEAENLANDFKPDPVKVFTEEQFQRLEQK